MTGNPKLDDRVWQALRGRIAELATASVKAGIVGQEAEAERDGHTNAEIGAIHEYGAVWVDEDGVEHVIVQRSFIRSTFVNKRDDLIRLQARLANLYVTGKIDKERALGLLGAWAAGAIKATITSDGNLAPNKPSTIARKHSSRPLVDTGALVGSISWIVVP